MSSRRVIPLTASFVCSVEKDEVTRHRRRIAISAVLEVANLTDHDDVRILTENGAQTIRERQPDLRLHIDLRHAWQTVFHRLLDGDDASASVG
jgi:hypothetical protein